MQNVIISFRQEIFGDTSTSGFKYELILRSLLHTCFVAIFNAFLKIFDAESLEKMSNGALVQIQAT